jgi:hypothetical protein
MPWVNSLVVKVTPVIPPFMVASAFSSCIIVGVPLKIAPSLWIQSMVSCTLVPFSNLPLRLNATICHHVPSFMSNALSLQNTLHLHPLIIHLVALAGIHHLDAQPLLILSIH